MLRKEGKLTVLKIEEIRYSCYHDKLPDSALAHITSEFDPNYSFVYRFRYVTSKGEIRSINVSILRKLAFSPLVASNMASHSFFGKLPLLNEDEFSILLNLYAAKEAHKLLYFSNPYERLDKYSDDEVREKICSFLPSTETEKPKKLEEIVTTEKTLAQEVMKSMSKYDEILAQELAEVAA